LYTFFSVRVNKILYNPPRFSRYHLHKLRYFSSHYCLKAIQISCNVLKEERSCTGQKTEQHIFLLVNITIITMKQIVLVSTKEKKMRNYFIGCNPQPCILIRGIACKLSIIFNRFHNIKIATWIKVMHKMPIII
jgi:hypothetical protein